jgi:hypothetical protein
MGPIRLLRLQVLQTPKKGLELDGTLVILMKTLNPIDK